MEDVKAVIKQRAKEDSKKRYKTKVIIKQVTEMFKTAKNKKIK